MNDLNHQFSQNLLSGTALNKERRKRKTREISKRIPARELSEYVKDGWIIGKQSEKFVRIKKQKSPDAAFEDQVWSIFADMGFTFMNSGRFFKMPYSDDYSLTQQVDIVAIDDETILIVECKAADSLVKNRSFKETIEAIGGKKEGMIAVLRKVFPDTKHRIKFAFATKNYVILKPDLDRLNNFDIAYFQEEELDYYQGLTDHLGPSAKYQFLGNLFQGQKIPELDNRVPAIKSKLGSHTFYLFSIEPERLLKICYVLHRTKANKALMPTYQRLIKKARLRSIDKFLQKGGFFPNSITISIDTDRPLQFDLANTQCEDSLCSAGILHLPQKYRSAFIIDGQHRVYGYAWSKYKSSNTLPVVAFENLKRSTQVELFMQINENQKTVTKNLRNTLNADLLWNSKDLTEAVRAIKLKVAQELGENRSSPLYERVIIGENKKTPIKCITIDTISSAIDRCNFLGTVTKDSIKGIGTFYDGNAESTVQRLADYLIGCFNYIEKLVPDAWALGEKEDGYLTINPTIYALILIINDICDHLVKTQGINARLVSMESLVNDTAGYLDPVILYFRNLPLPDRVEMRRFYGIGGRTKYWRTLEQVIKETRPEFTPEGLEEYIRNNSKRYNTESFVMIRDVETFLKDDVRLALINEYGKNWWRKGVPLDVYEAAELLASKKNREIDDPTKAEEPWNQIHLIDYRKIILHNWSKLFQTKYSYPGLKGNKEEKTGWLSKLNTIRNQNFHEYSVSEEEYKFLTEAHNWILSLSNLGSPPASV